MIWPLLAPLWFTNAIVLGPSTTRYGAHGCLAVATWRSYWPGRKPLVQCEHHRTWSAQVAEALGFRLESVELPVREWPEPDAATQRFRAMEMM